LLAVRAGGHDMTCLFRDRVLPSPGETIRIRPVPDLVHVFDEQTGLRLAH
jgi:multiple sugar transport system ATP-binding protein